MGRPLPVSPKPELPTQLAERLRADLGLDAQALSVALASVAPVSIRVNPHKPSPADGTPVPWCTTGRYLAERPAFTFDPLLHAGAYYVQEASSMLLEQAFKATGLADQDLLALDLCAAPGGKSTHLRSLLTPASLLVANEVDGQRRSILQENLWKWGLGNVLISGGRSNHFHRLADTFDVVVLDAPCSGEGMFRKDPYALAQWKPALVEQCALVQRELVDAAWTCLRPGGVLIYSTCTWEQRENEAHLHHLMAQGGEPLLGTAPPEGVVCSDTEAAGWRCYPHLMHGEGFFLSAIRKPGERTPYSPSHTSEGAIPPRAEHLHDPMSTLVLEQEQVRYAVDRRWERMVTTLRNALPVVAPGIPIAIPKGRALHPHPALALSVLLDGTTVNAVELDEEQAIRYLKGEALPAQDARGVAWLCYRGLGLGWAQGAGRRWNNQWPAPWRIRSAQPSSTRVSWSSLIT
jgi:16S rRNA C967 or C1407 C5-methylase (RsmB/RsmF family)/NOL1/NOP2/fmu family ribosome biogenesis protein